MSGINSVANESRPVLPEIHHSVGDIELSMGSEEINVDLDGDWTSTKQRIVAKYSSIQASPKLVTEERISAQERGRFKTNA